MKKKLFLGNKPGLKNEKKRYLFAILTLSVFFFFVLFFANKNFNDKIQSFLFAGLKFAIEPFRDLNDFIRRFKTEFGEKSSLVKENKSLKLKMEFLETENAKAKIALSELEELEKNLGRLSFYEINPILAKIVFRPPEVFFDSLMVDVGEKQGVKRGMKAIAYGNVFIGRVSKLYENSSEILLISNFNHEENAILEKSRSAVIIKGRGNYEMEIELPRSFKVEIGEMVYTLTPKPYLMGAVFKIETTEADPFQKILLKFPFNMQNLNSLFLAD